jgi:hypothetical protein
MLSWDEIGYVSGGCSWFVGGCPFGCGLGALLVMIFAGAVKNPAGSPIFPVVLAPSMFLMQLKLLPVQSLNSR